MDVRVGGTERLKGRWEGGMVSTFDATYHDVIPNERLVYCYVMHLDDKKISVSQATLQLKAEDRKTTLTVTEQGAFLDGYDDAGSREQGTGYLLDALGASLQEAERIRACPVPGWASGLPGVTFQDEVSSAGVAPTPAAPTVMAGSSPVGVRISGMRRREKEKGGRREKGEDTPPPLVGGGWGEGLVGAHEPLPPTPSHKGRGSTFCVCPSLILTPMGSTRP